MERKLLNKRRRASKDEGTCAEYGCGDFYKDGDSCQCNAKCAKHENCCADYSDECIPGSCAPDAYGCTDYYVEDAKCQCNGKCAKHDNCCSDYTKQCEANPSPGPAPPGDVEKPMDDKVKVLVMSTPGANSPCCGCPDPSDPKCGCYLHKGDRTYQMGTSIKEGILETAPDTYVRQVDISKEGECLSYDELATFDAIVVGAPVWNGIPSPDILAFMNLWPISSGSNKMRCKVGAAFTTGGGYYAGLQTTIETFHRFMQTFQMVIVGGSEWQTGQGAAAVTGIEPYNLGRDEDGSYVVSPLFLADAKGLGARIGNFTSIMKETPSFCDVFLGMTGASKR